MTIERLLAATRDLPTPALVVDAAAVDRNVARAAAYFAGRGVRLRPHFKAHKCTELMRRQLAGDSALAVGDAILLIPAHVDPTVNLHAALYGVEEDGTVHRWRIDARRP